MAKKKKQTTLNKMYSFPLWQVAIFVLVFAGVGAYAVYSSQAAPRRSTTKATLSVSPNPMPANQPVQMTVTGCGYNTDKYTITNVTIQKDGIGGGSSYNTSVNPDGCLSGIPNPTVLDADNYMSFPAGNYTVSIYQAIGGKVSRQPNATASLVVQ